MTNRPAMKADVTGLTDGKMTGRRENGFHGEIAVIDPATGAAIVTARIYWPGQTAYCAVWVAGNGKYGMGSGKAGGGGYHKPSAALSAAISDAGITLNRSISGVGDGAMDEACEAIARAVTGKRRFIVHRAFA